MSMFSDPMGETDPLVKATEAATAVVSEVRMLRHEVAKERRARKVLTGVICVMCFFGLGLVYVAVANRETLQQATLTQDYLVECTTPGPRTPTAEDPRTGHPCYDQAQARQAPLVEAVGNAVADKVLERIPDLSR